MVMICRIRRLHGRKSKSEREIARITGLSRNTVSSRRRALAWNGLFAPAGTPADVVNRINADVNTVMKDPAMRATLLKQGMIIGGGSRPA